MYAVSEAYHAALAAPGRTERISGTITLAGGNGTVLPLGDGVVKAGSLAIDNRCVNGEELEFGAVYAGQLTLTLDSDADRYALYGAVIALQWGIRLADGSWETLPMGVYTVTEAVRQGRYLALTALDCLVHFEAAYDGASLLGTPFALLNYLCEKAGVTLANTEAEIAALPGGSEQYQLDGSGDGLSTWRDGLALLAQVLGGFATATRDGRLKICTFGAAVAAVVPAASRFTTEISDYRTFYKGLTAATDDGALESWSGAETGLVMAISGNPLFGRGLPEARQARVDGLCKVLCGIEYTPAAVTMAGDPALECGDRLLLADAPAGAGKTENAETLLTGYRWVYRGRESLEGVGKNPRLTGIKNKTERTTAALKTQVSGDKLITNYFVNAAAITLAGTMQRLLSMSVTTVKQTSAVFWAEALLRVPEAAEGAELSLQYQKNGAILTGFAPVQTLRSGRQIVNLLLPLIDLDANTTVRLDLYASLSAGTCGIAAEELRAVVQGQGLAGNAGWDGTLSYRESIGSWAAASGETGLLALRESLLAAAAAPTPLPLAEAVGLWAAAAGGVGFLGVGETLAHQLDAGN